MDELLGHRQILPGLIIIKWYKEWVSKRLKAVRFAFISLPGRVVRRARTLIIRLSWGHPSYRLLLRARKGIVALAHSPP